MKSLSRAVLATLLASTALPALSADIPSRAKAPAPVLLSEPSPWMIRLRALTVVPQSSASVDLTTSGVTTNTSSLKASTSVVPELDITYFFTKNIAAELILGVTPHDIKGTGALAGQGKIGHTWLLPPTLTVQYHFTDFGAIKPYVGAGLNYTFTFGNENKGNFTAFKVKNAPGFALQAGVDYMLDQHWGLNLDVKKIWLRPDATGAIGATSVKAKVKLDPWLIGAGVVYRF